MCKNFLFSSFLILLFLFLDVSPSSAQEGNFFVLDSIVLKGNRKTKDKIISRELDFQVGDTIWVYTLSERFNENKKRILNTGLFTLVQMNMKDWDLVTGHAYVQLDLTENWFIYPLPIFELADRNFNVWWNDQNRSLSRVNYGIRATHINFTGNRDVLRLVAHFGYTRKFEAKYRFPYVNKKQTLGLFGNIFYSDRKEIGYKTEENKTLFAKNNDEILLTRFRINGSIDFRPELNTYHRINFGYHHNTVDPFVTQELNPDYFLGGETDLKFFVLEYELRLDHRIFFFYPEGGHLLALNLKKEGLGIFNEYNNLALSAEYEKHYSLGVKILLGARLKAKTNLIRNKVAFANNTGLGYGIDFVRGYELYVLDGTDYVYTKSSLKYKLYERLIPMKKLMPVKAFKQMFLQVFLSANFDTGYVNERDYIETNVFNNRWIYGFGPGLDVVMYNNFLFKIEYSVNHLGEGGLYLSNLINF